MENKECKPELEDISKLKSPYRQSLFRSCKSPFKPNPNETKSSTPCKSLHKVTKSSTPRKVEKEPVSKRGLEISSVIEKFPQIHENFEITKKAGEGTFSKVYLAKLRKDPSQIFALKHLIPTSSPGRIENELKCLQVLGGVNNVLPVRSVLRNGDHIIFILPYVPHARFTDYMQQMTLENIRNYMFHLFISLKHVHQLRIIHRDIKPSNFLYSHQLDQYFLIDFGLAMPVPGSVNNMLNDYTNSDNNDSNSNEKSCGRSKVNINNCKHAANSICDCCKGRSRQNAPRAGTPGFRSPEVILRHPNQTTAVDMWAAGVILLSIMSQRYPFFKAKDDMEALAQIITIFGSDKMKIMADSIGKDFICVPAVEAADDLKTLCEKLAQRTCINKNKKHKISSDIQLNPKRKRVDNSEGALLEHPKKNMTNKHLSELTSKSESDISNGNKKVDKSDLIEEKENLSADNAEKKNNEVKEKDNLSKNKTIDCTCRNCIVLPDSVYDLLERLMELDPYKRISAEEALKHPFITDLKN